MEKLNIVGGGLAGAEAAWQAANRGVEVNLYEMRGPNRKTPAHQTDKIAELVCSNSFRTCLKSFDQQHRKSEYHHL